MSRAKLLEVLDDFFGFFRQSPINAHQVSVLVDECGVDAPEMPSVGEIEEKRAAPEKGLEVSRKPLGHELPELRKKLPFASGPLQEWKRGCYGRRFRTPLQRELHGSDVSIVRSPGYHW
jgi:hypothetical protein